MNYQRFFHLIKHKENEKIFMDFGYINTFRIIYNA